MLELKLLKKELNIFRLIYLRLFGKEILSVYTYGKDNMFGVQVFNFKLI